MIIKIDFREKELIKIINDLLKKKYNNCKVNIISENLPLGDIIICDDDDIKEYVIIERKTLNDLSSSIKDGRYNEQSFRLNECNIHNHNIIYLIEGDNDIYNLSSNSKYTPIKTLLSSMISIIYYKGFSLYKSKNLSESADFIICFADKLEREKNNKISFYNNISNKESIQQSSQLVNEENNKTNAEITTTNTTNTNEVDNNKNYCEAIKRNKKNNITIDNIGEIILSQIPNVSAQTAIAVMKRFGNIKNLIDSLTQNVDLSDIYVNNRRISKTSISNIYKYLLQKDNDIIIKTE
jgi:ERCC4-type nuclease